MERTSGVPLDWLIEPNDTVRAFQVAARARAVIGQCAAAKFMPSRWVEVGVWDAAFSCAVAAAAKSDIEGAGMTWTPRIWLADTWREPARDSEYWKSGDETARVGQAKLDAVYAKAQENARAIGGRILRADSVSCAAIVVTAEFVFIDADHSEYGVARDIRAWWPRVVRGGFLCGHDWGLYGVKAAVEKWLPEIGRAAGDVALDEDATWFLRKS